MLRVRAQRGFTTIELLIALFIASTGILALIGTLDMSRRLTTLAEMKEVAAHHGQQSMEQIRSLDYDKIALDTTPATSTDPANPGFYVSTSSGTATYRWNQKADAPIPHTENLLICATAGPSCPAAGKVPAAAESWSDGRVSGKIYRYVTAVDDPSCLVVACPGSDYKRVTVAVTVDQADGPGKPILFSVLVADPDTVPTGTVRDGDENPLTDPKTQCANSDGVLEDCAHTIDGEVSSFYLYDTPATFEARQEISASHPSHPTVAPTGNCTTDDTSGCPVPDLMGIEPPPDPTVTPPLYSYSNEITGGTWPGGTVIRRDTGCDGTPTAGDNTKGHFWVTAPLAAPLTVTGDAALSLSTVTFNAVSAAVTLCVRFYNVPGSLGNLVETPPAAIGSDSYSSSTWPTTVTQLAFTMDFRGSEPDYTIPQGSRVGVRIWVAASSTADIAAVYDHPQHASYIQVNGAN